MLLDDLLERNRGFVRSRENRPLPDPAPIRAAFIACYDPRLDSILRPALGLAPAEGIVLRTAGALVQPEGDPLRSLVLAVFLFGVVEAYVIGHTSCRMKSFPIGPFIDAFRARGVARDSFGAQDLRDWAGAFGETKTAVLGSIRAIASAPMIPADLLVGGLLLDDETGALEILVPPATVAATRAAPGLASAATVGTAAPPLPEEEAASIPVPTPAVAEVPELTREIESIRGFVRALESTAGWREDLARLRQELDRQKSPVARLTLVEKFVRRAAVNARGIGVAFEQVKREAAPEALVALFHRIGRTG